MSEKKTNDELINKREEEEELETCQLEMAVECVAKRLHREKEWDMYRQELTDSGRGGRQERTFIDKSQNNQL